MYFYYSAVWLVKHYAAGKNVFDITWKLLDEKSSKREQREQFVVIKWLKRALIVSCYLQLEKAKMYV